jgi:hypothetical protein
MGVRTIFVVIAGEPYHPQSWHNYIAMSILIIFWQMTAY